MTRAIVADSRRVALDLHALLRDIDPARWRDEREGGVRERLETIQDELVELLDASWPQLTPPPVGAQGRREDPRAIRGRIAELYQLIREHAPACDGPPSDRRAAWMALRDQLQPAYEGFAASLRAWSIHVPSLRPTNYTRNVFHVASGLGVVLLVEYVLVTPGLLLGTAIAGAAAAWSMELSRRLSPAINKLLMRLFGPVAHPHEAHRVNSATWYASAMVVLAAAFDPAVGVAALAILGLGDPCAAIVGRRWGRVKLIHGRSLEGSLAFALMGGLAALAALRFWHADLGWSATLAITAGAVVPATLAELLARRIDDNLAIPLVAAAGGTLLLGVLT